MTMRQRAAIPPGRSGKWIVDSFTIKYYQGINPYVSLPKPFQSPEGRYTQLRYGSQTFVTDEPHEIQTQHAGIKEALQRGGKVLTTGLGLGLFVDAVLSNPAGAGVESITVVEQSEDVIRLVAPSLWNRWGARFKVVRADAFVWRPALGVRYTVVWHDIWPSATAAGVLDEVRRLCVHYCAIADWQGSWPVAYRYAMGNSLRGGHNSKASWS